MCLIYDMCLIYESKINKLFYIQTCKRLSASREKNDGGYLVSQSDIVKSDALIGLGISDDWSFEENFVKQKDMPVYAYDASINFKFWIKKTLAEIIKNPFNLYPLKKFFSYKKHIKKLAHIHANNVSPIRLDDELPLILELTFSKYCEVQKVESLPHILDMPNIKIKPEINLSIEKE